MKFQGSQCTVEVLYSGSILRMCEYRFCSSSVSFFFLFSFLLFILFWMDWGKNYNNEIFFFFTELNLFSCTTMHQQEKNVSILFPNVSNWKLIYCLWVFSIYFLIESYTNRETDQQWCIRVLTEMKITQCFML